MTFSHIVTSTSFRSSTMQHRDLLPADYWHTDGIPRTCSCAARDPAVVARPHVADARSLCWISCVYWRDMIERIVRSESFSAGGG